ncbi:MAG: tRNA-dihydrouridine synthase family protein [Ardenticatenales bacterium]|nr:tRNA-dihydrouridine synthase family protein [Ardenticatenales bacterium]
MHPVESYVTTPSARPPAPADVVARGLPPGHIPGQGLTALAPMQDVTHLPFMRVMAHYGAPDYFFTEYFRVHEVSCLEPHILRSITDHGTGRPVFAQLIGEHIPSMVRTAKALSAYPVAGIDLNMGCPAPKIYKKNVGGGLLRDPDKVDALLGALRDAVPGRFTVKMRVGFDNTEPFERILALVNKHGIDLLTVHGRTVAEMYRPGVRYDLIAQAVRTVRCPVLANGDIHSPAKAVEVLALTGAAGVMIGRHAIRNPWIFRQTREALAGRPITPVTLAETRAYIDRLYGETESPTASRTAHVHKLKKYLNFVGQSVDPTGAFLYEMRRAMTHAELFAICDRHLLADPDRHASIEPYPGIFARPNAEAPMDGCSLETIPG